MTTRSRKSELQYSKYRNTTRFKDNCVFCNINKDDKDLIKEYRTFYVISTKFRYTMWDSQGVLDHLLVVPKQHTESLGDLTASEYIEFMDILTSYEKRGYDFSARAPNSNRKTVIHQHTHLIKLDRKTKNLIFYIKKPYLRIIK